MTAPMPVYAIYCRLSRKKTRSRTDKTVERQEALCRKYAAEQGLAIAEGHLYVDPHRSAWKPDGKREAWDAMIAAGQRREFDGLLAYKVDRFARNVRDAEDLVDLAGKRRVVVDGPHSGQIDLSTASGRHRFREAAVQAAAESDNTSERVKDALAERAANGLLLGGGRLFGFEVLSDVRAEEDDVDARQKPDEVELIREAAARLLAGEHLAHIAAFLNERGITTVRGGQWNGRNLGRTLGAARYGGVATFNGKEVGQAAGDPVLDADTYAQVQAVLAGRRRGRRATGLWPLTGVLRCGCCTTTTSPRTMAGHTSSRNGARQYICARSNGGCGRTVMAVPVEEIVKARVLADANDPELVAELSAEGAELSEARAAASTQVERLDKMLADLEERRALEQIRLHAYEAAKRVLDKRITAAEAALEVLGAPATLGSGIGAILPAEYDAMTPAEVKLLIAGLHLEITVLPVGPGAVRNRFDPRRVQIRP